MRSRRVLLATLLITTLGPLTALSGCASKPVLSSTQVSQPNPEVNSQPAKANADDKRIAESLAAAAQNGDTDAMVELSKMIAEGRGFEKDPSLAFLWAKTAAEQGNAKGALTLYAYYRDGTGVKADLVESEKWYRIAEEKADPIMKTVLKAGRGDTEAQFFLGNMMTFTGNYTEAARFFSMGAERGHAASKAALAGLYSTGSGVPKNPEMSFKLYSEAAGQGNSIAQFNLGLMYANGEMVTKNDAEAVKWLRKAAEQGLDAAQNNLGRMYKTGQGVVQNDAEAANWFRKAASQGYALAQLNLGTMYASGEGVAQNYIRAYALFNIAAASGQENARHNKDIVAQNMTPAQIAEAQTISADWVPGKPIKIPF